MRIAFVTREYVTEDTFDCGVASYVYRVARTLADLGEEVHVLTRSEAAEGELQHENITVHRLKVSKLWHRLNRITRYRLADSIHLVGFSLRIHRKLKQLHSSRPLDLIQIPHSPFCGLASVLLLSVPHVLRVSWYEPAWRELASGPVTLDARIVQLFERLQLNASDHVCTPSATLRDILVKRLERQDIRVIRSPCHLEKTRWDESVYEKSFAGKKYLLFFGRFELRKGFHVLIKALPAVLDRIPDAHVALIGRDLASTLAPSMASYAREQLLPYADRLTILDRLPVIQLYPIIGNSHLVVLPSLMDNLPNACLEAMALGKVVIGTRGASFDELIDDGKTGFLISPNAPPELSEKLIRAWNDPQLETIGQAAAARVQEFGPESAVTQLQCFYREVLDQQRSRGANQNSEWWFRKRRNSNG